MHMLNRLYRHLWSAQRETRMAFPEVALARIEAAVGTAETGHTGELRVVIEAGLDAGVWRGVPDARERAVALFAQLGVWDTEGNSGVLLYVLMAEHRFEIVADRGINAKVGHDGWQHIVDDAVARFRAGEYEAGLLAAVETVGDLLRRHFPADDDEGDELSNRPVMM